MRAWVVYTVLRVLTFAVPFGVLVALGLDWWWAAPLAAVIGFCLSYVLLRRPREAVARALADARASAGTRGSDETAEDDDA